MLQKLTSTETLETLVGRKITKRMMKRTNGYKTRIFLPIEVKGIPEPVYFVYSRWSPEISKVADNSMLAMGFDYEFEGIPFSMVKNGYKKKILIEVLHSLSFKVLNENYKATKNSREQL